MKTHLDKHVENRTDTNFDIVTKHLHDDVDCVQKNHWREGLAFLRSTKFTEPTFRQTLICLINFRLEFAVLSTFFQVIVCCVEAHKTAKDAKLKNHEDYDPTAIWMLPFVFERLVLAPNPDNNNDTKTSINQLIHRRLRLFRSGQIKQLYEESNCITSKTPGDYAANPVSKQRSAQIAADNDNFKSANARLTKDTPVEPIDDNNINILFGLHPKSYALRLVSYVTNGRYGTRASSKSPPTKNFRHFAISPKNIFWLFYDVCIEAKLQARNLTPLTFSSNWQDVTHEQRSVRQNAIFVWKFWQNFSP